MAGKSPEATAYQHIRQEFQTHLDEAAAPEEVRPFLLDQWARLMTGIFMAKGNQDPDWHAGWDTVNALLWSLSPKHGRVDTMKMLRILPTLLARLHEGCTALGLDAKARDRLFADLAMLHAAIAREGLQLQPDEALPELPASLAGDRRVHDKEIKALQPSTMTPNAQSGATPVLPELKLGDWVSFTLPKGLKQLKLTWLSPQQGMYLFANAQGLDSLSLTRARLVAKFQTGEACLVSGRLTS